MSASEADMGPFAGMDPKLVEALTRYGSPPVRETTTVVVRRVGDYEFGDLPTTIDGWIGWLEAAREDTPEEYRPALQCGLEYTRSHYDSGDSADLTVWYDRPETDAEMQERVGQGIAYLQQKEAEEFRQYATLKQKFERKFEG